MTTKQKVPLPSSSLVTSAFLVRTYQEATRYVGNIIPAPVLQSRGHEIRLKMKDKSLVTGAIFFDKIPIKVTEIRELLPIYCK